MKKTLLIFTLSLSLFVIISCGKKAVTRTAADTTIDLSGRWNDTDSRLVAEEMIQDCLLRPWLINFKTQNNSKAPTVIVGSVKNKSYEHIAVQTFVKDLERALINSGHVQFVADAGARGDVRAERRDQAMHAAAETQKGPGQEIGADFMLQGQINAILDESGGQQVRFYQVELELVNMANNLKAWIGQKKLKKLIEKSKVKW